MKPAQTCRLLLAKKLADGHWAVLTIGGDGHDGTVYSHKKDGVMI